MTWYDGYQTVRWLEIHPNKHYIMKNAENTKKKKFAFIRPTAYPYPIPNQILPGVLAKALPEYAIDIIDIKSTLMKQPVLFFMNMLAIGLEYGGKIAAGHIKPRETVYTTQYINTKIGHLVRDRIKQGDYAFTFQIQSLFDASTGVLPHFVYTDHTHLARLTYPGFDRRKLRHEKWIEIERGIYHNATVNFTRSSNISESLREQYGIPDSKIVLAGVGNNVVIEDSPLNNYNYQNKNILFVGIDWERKGGPDLLLAFEKVLERHPDATLTIVGASPKINVKNCNIIGKVPLEEMKQHFQKASIFCLPTKMEPFGVAFIEALYYKLPIVATNVGAIPDFVKPGGNGYLIESGDVASLIGYLDSLLSDPLKCKTFGLNGFLLAKANYNWDKVAEKMSNTIRKFVS